MLRSESPLPFRPTIEATKPTRSLPRTPWTLTMSLIRTERGAGGARRRQHERQRRQQEDEPSGGPAPASGRLVLQSSQVRRQR